MAQIDNNGGKDITADEIHETVRDFLLQKGLYAKQETESAIGSALVQVLREPKTIRFDAHCPTCRRETPFRVYKQLLKDQSLALDSLIHAGAYKPVPRTPLFAVTASCTRQGCSMFFILREASTTIEKIGQFPSMADIAAGELRDIDHGLDRVDRKELGSALGLHAHDVALGSFVYIRRVFERMIERARASANGSEVSDADWQDLRMDERIQALKNHLPAELVENRAVFRILSKGIHELTEEECMLYFPSLKAAIFQMLEAEEHLRQKAIRKAETAKQIKMIEAQLNSKQ